MTVHRRIDVSEVGEVTVVRFVDRKILDETSIHELGQELVGLVETEKRENILLNFTKVEFLSSAALGQLINLNQKVNEHGGKLILSNIRPEIFEVFMITKLNMVFTIKQEEEEALAAF